MKDPVLSLLERLESAVQNDAEYQMLHAQYEEAFSNFKDTLDTLTEEQKDAFYELIGICGEIYLRRLELLVLEKEKGSG